MYLLVVMVLSLFSTFLAAHPALAQGSKEPTSFKNVQLWVEPEYDDPRLLVMLEGKIAGANPPATVRFLVPAAAEMFSAGSKDAQGKYSGGPPARKPSGIPGWDEISYEVKTETFRVEYYDPVIPVTADKKISYDFRSLYPISDLRVSVQQPVAASNFAVTPSAQFKGTDEGMVLHQYDFSNLDMTKPLHFDISYAKSDPEPSVKSPSLNGPGQSAAGSSSSRPMVIIGILAVVGAVLVFGLKFLSKSRNRPRTRQQLRNAQGRPQRPAPGGRKGNRPQSAAVPGNRSGQENGPKRFCPQCGHRQDNPGGFCTECGAKLK